jgi:hypothetical protein
VANTNARYPKRFRASLFILVILLGLGTNLHGHQLRAAPGILEGFDSVFGRESPHNQRQLTVGCGQEAAVHFSTIGVTLTAVRDLPHSKQHAFNRDVINPQDGHILCDPSPAICGFSLRIL